MSPNSNLLIPRTVDESAVASSWERWPQKFGQLDFRKGTHQGGHAERMKMIDRSHDLPVIQQSSVLGIARSTVYYTPEPVSPEHLALMRRIDELHLE